MKFTPKTEQQIVEENNLKPGIYDFEVTDTDDKPSKAGNEMITLKLHVYDDLGNPRILYDYLLEDIAYKLRHAAEACGLLEQYDTGYLSHGDFAGKKGKLKIAIQKGKNGYPDKSAVSDYIKPSESSAVEPRAAVANAASLLDDEIPF